MPLAAARWSRRIVTILWFLLAIWLVGAIAVGVVRALVSGAGPVVLAPGEVTGAGGPRASPQPSDR